MINDKKFNSLNIDSNTNTKENNIDNDDILLDLSDENEKNLLLEPNTTDKKIILTKKKLSKKNEVFLTLKPEIPKKIEDRIICFSRRRKLPKKLEDLTGYLITLSFFIFFSILITICLSAARNKSISDNIKSFHKWILVFIWLTSIISVVCLTDAASADPGRQRGTPISKFKYDKSKIKKIVGGQKYSLKYCVTCHLIRDIRTFHCDTCGLCIEKHDHHCNYLSNCVGVYNYKKFFVFIIIACIHVTIVFLTCFHYLFVCQGDDEEEDSGYEWITFLITLIIVFGGFFLIFTWWMVIQHIVTIVQNRTTREFIKRKEYGIYNKGCRQNCKEALCSNEIKEI